MRIVVFINTIRANLLGANKQSERNQRREASVLSTLLMLSGRRFENKANLRYICMYKIYFKKSIFPQYLNGCVFFRFQLSISLEILIVLQIKY